MEGSRTLLTKMPARKRCQLEIQQKQCMEAATDASRTIAACLEKVVASAVPWLSFNGANWKLASAGPPLLPP